VVKTNKVKMWYSDYRKHCAGCSYFVDVATPVDSEAFASLPFEKRPVYVYCSLINKKCKRVEPWEE
jgi:hypothetical protein